MYTCFYCNSEEHNGEECPEKELEEDIGSIQNILDEIKSFPVSELFDSSKMEKNPLWGHSIFSQYLLFSSYSELLKKEVEKSGSAIGSNNSQAEDFYERGENFFVHESISEAIPCLERAIELDSNYFPPTIVRAYCFIEKGVLEKAESALLEGISLAPSTRVSSYLSMLLARIAQCSKDKDRAKELAHKSASSDSAFFLPLYYLSMLYTADGNIEKAVHFLGQLEQKKGALFAGFFIDRETEHARSGIVSSMKEKIKLRTEKIKELLREAEKLRDEAKEQEGDMFAPHNFKIAGLKIEKVTESPMSSFQGIIDTLRDVEDAILYLNTAKSLTATRKELTKKAVESFKKNTIKTGLSSGLLVSGWAFVFGGFVGVVRYVTANAPPLHIVYWALGIMTAAFTILQLNCWVLLMKYKNNFMKKYIASFKSQKMDELFQKEMSSYKTQDSEEFKTSLF